MKGRQLKEKKKRKKLQVHPKLYIFGLYKSQVQKTIYSICTYIPSLEGIRSACCDHYENKVLLSISNIYIADEDLRIETSRISNFMLLTLNKTLFSHVSSYVYIHTYVHISPKVCESVFQFITDIQCGEAWYQIYYSIQDYY